MGEFRKRFGKKIDNLIYTYDRSSDLDLALRIAEVVSQERRAVLKRLKRSIHTSLVLDPYQGAVQGREPSLFVEKEKKEHPKPPDSECLGHCPECKEGWLGPGGGLWQPPVECWTCGHKPTVGGSQ